MIYLDKYIFIYYIVLFVVVVVVVVLYVPLMMMLSRLNIIVGASPLWPSIFVWYHYYYCYYYYYNCCIVWLNSWSSFSYIMVLIMADSLCLLAFWLLLIFLLTHPRKKIIQIQHSSLDRSKQLLFFFLSFSLCISIYLEIYKIKQI